MGWPEEFVGESAEHEYILTSINPSESAEGSVTILEKMNDGAMALDKQDSALYSNNSMNEGQNSQG